MERTGNYVLTDPISAHKAAALGHALVYIAHRVLGILAVLAFTYGLLALEVELATLEQFTTPIIVEPLQHVYDRW